MNNVFFFSAPQCYLLSVTALSQWEDGVRRRRRGMMLIKTLKPKLGHSCSFDQLRADRRTPAAGIYFTHTLVAPITALKLTLTRMQTHFCILQISPNRRDHGWRRRLPLQVFPRPFQHRFWGKSVSDLYNSEGKKTDHIFNHYIYLVTFNIHIILNKTLFQINQMKPEV